MTLHEALEKVRRQQESIIGRVNSCLKSHEVLPGLMLLYAAIDGVSWLARPATAGDPKAAVHFQEWVKRYLLVHGEAMSPVDLWAARCAVLHTQTADSDLSMKQSARPVWYRLPDEHAIVQAVAASPQIAWTINPVNLTLKFSHGLRAWLSDVEQTANMHGAFCARAERLFNDTIMTDRGHTSHVASP